MIQAILLPLLIGAAIPSGEDDLPGAAAVTAPGRSMERALADLLEPGGAHQPDERTLLFLIDPTPELIEARFGALFEAALARAEQRPGRLRIGIARVGARNPLLVAPTLDHQAALAALRAGLAEARSGLANVYADLRRVAAGLKSGAELILVSLENGAAEDDLERTVAALARVRFSAIAREAYLADSYWAARPGQRLRGCRLAGGDGPLIDLPWGWLFQQTVTNEVTPSGFAAYGLTRLAAASGGRIHLFTPPQAAQHRCIIYGECPFCSGDHIVTDESYRTQSLALLAPATTSRSRAARAAMDDPWFRATQRAWKEAARAGLVRSRPALKSYGSRLKEERNPLGRWVELGGSLAFGRLARRADKSAARCARILAALVEETRKLALERTFTRARAMAELTRVLLAITRVNLLAYAAWCREVAPAMIGEQRLALQPPEKPWFRADQRPVGVGWTNFSLCHGVRPFLELDLPGGEAFAAELRELDRVVAAFALRYAHTPYVVAVHRLGLARFHPTFRGRYVPPPRRRPGSSASEDPLTERGRPTRPSGGGGSRTGSGPTTGGKGG